MATTPIPTSGTLPHHRHINGAPPAPARASSVPFPSSSVRTHLQFHPSTLWWRRTNTSAAAFVNHESIFTAEDRFAAAGFATSGNGGNKLQRELRPCEVYVCNLPRSWDIPQLVELFQGFGTVVAVRVCKNPETGLSKGCAYVTMGSKPSAIRAILKLDAIDVEGREMRVRLAYDTDRNSFDSVPVKSLMYESPYKLYIGNLAWSVKPEDLRNKFSQFGNLTSVRVLYDYKAGKNRAYGFVSFSTESELQASLSLDGTNFHSRNLVVRKSADRPELQNPEF
ncbi:28 kDa ribonucleoprotein, chloroplastic [Linum perenne]